MIKRVEAATVIRLRRRSKHWQVLMGQSHVVDWLKSKGPTVRHHLSTFFFQRRFVLRFLRFSLSINFEDDDDLRMVDDVQ